MLMEAFDQFNKASIQLEEKYAIIEEEAKKLREEVQEKNVELSKLSTLLESVLYNSNSCVIAVDEEYNILVKNPVAEKLLAELGDDKFLVMLEKYSRSGVFDHEEDERTLRVSVGLLDTEEQKGYVYVINDITHLKNLEMERNRDEKLKLMGEMAANIAHDIRNPLGSIELFASLLERDLHKNESGMKLTRSIIKGVRTINAIITNILIFTKEIQLEKTEQYVADIVDDVILYMQHLMRDKNIRFKNLISEDDKISCDKELFKQVVMNIIHNAIDAVEDNGVITMESFTDNSSSGFSVNDNGSGISTDMRKKLFIPFQTTKAKGTGLGLAIVYKIVKAHDGNITLDSDGKSYTTFKIELPR
ncbi:MAG: two-component sensor histidine kinase [Denitrovibrio sp.]|nr:MAG: two-component sensor histidine kinase [Denitrovibrio sp.]